MDTIRRRSVEGVAVLLWFALPFGAISFMASKLYYYADPFLPPVGLAGGFLMAFFWRQLQPLFRHLVDETDRRITTWAPFLMVARRQPVLRWLLLGIAAAAVAIMLRTMTDGPVHVDVANVKLFKNTGFVRPWLVAVVCALLAGSSTQVGRFLGVPLLMLLMLPVHAYPDTLARLAVVKHPMRTARECVEGVRAEGAGGMSWDGLYVAGTEKCVLSSAHLSLSASASMGARRGAPG